jgi:hypothetical protein
VRFRCGGNASDAAGVAAETLATRDSLREPVAAAGEAESVSSDSSGSDWDDLDESENGASKSVSETAPLVCATCGKSEPPANMRHACGNCGRPNHPWCGTDSDDWSLKVNLQNLKTCRRAPRIPRAVRTSMLRATCVSLSLPFSLSLCVFRSFYLFPLCLSVSQRCPQISNSIVRRVGAREAKEARSGRRQ